jgi:hypothetical protein
MTCGFRFPLAKEDDKKAFLKSIRVEFSEFNVARGGGNDWSGKSAESNSV